LTASPIRFVVRKTPPSGERTQLEALISTGVRRSGVGISTFSASSSMPACSMTPVMPSTPARMANSSKRSPSPPS
jgi:hypothetical protein